MKASKVKQGKPYTIISENEKMDTSGMANKTISYTDMMVEYEPMKKPLRMMVKEFAMGKAK
jgi:hypothetical protein